MKKRNSMKSMICAAFVVVFAIGCGMTKPEIATETETKTDLTSETSTTTEALTETESDNVSEFVTESPSESEMETEESTENEPEEVPSYTSWQDAYTDFAEHMRSGEGIMVENGSGEEGRSMKMFEDWYCFYDINKDNIPELICMPESVSENYDCFTFWDDKIYLFETAGRRPSGWETICHVKDTKYYLTQYELFRETRLCTLENGECKIVLHAYSPEWKEDYSAAIKSGNYTMCYLDEQGNELTKQQFQEEFQNLTGYAPFDPEDFDIEESWMENMYAYLTQELPDGALETVPSTDLVYYPFDPIISSMKDWMQEIRK